MNRSTTGMTCVLLACLACRGTVQPSVEEGRALYGGNGCATCHGSSGRGDGRVASSLDERPRDFRDASAFKNGADEVSIAATLAKGLEPAIPLPVPATHQHLQHERRTMPKFDHLSDRERRSLALYVISLRESSKERQVGP